MPPLLAALTMLLVVVLVLARVQMLRRRGIDAMNFGKLDRSDFLIPPFALFYFYLIFAEAFHWPSPARQVLLQSQAAAWAGVLLCLAGLALFAWSLVSFGRSFRVGIDTEHPDALVTGGAFGITRNPLYVGFLVIFLGQFLIFPNVILLIYLVGAGWLINRQILREEAYLKVHYGTAYEAYCQRVRRYL